MSLAKRRPREVYRVYAEDDLPTEADHTEHHDGADAIEQDAGAGSDEELGALGLGPRRTGRAQSRRRAFVVTLLACACGAVVGLVAARLVERGFAGGQAAEGGAPVAGGPARPTNHPSAGVEIGRSASARESRLVVRPDKSSPQSRPPEILESRPSGPADTRAAPAVASPAASVVEGSLEQGQEDTSSDGAATPAIPSAQQGAAPVAGGPAVEFGFEH